MDINELMLESLLGLRAAHAWPGMPEVLTRLASHKARHWQVPVLACRAVGGHLEQALPAMAAIACLHSSILLIDDLLDNDPRGEYHRIGAPSAANLAIALQALGLEALAQMPLPPTSKVEALQSYNWAALAIAAGQERDIRNPSDEDAYWQVVELKSAPFFGTAMQLGVLAGGGSVEDAEQFKRLGNLYGEMIQIHDDLNDAMAVPANPDWELGRMSLPILFATQVDHAQREHFQMLRRELKTTSDLQVLDAAQRILLESGAISYGIYELVCRQHTAQNLLHQIAPLQASGLVLLLDELVLPVKKLFQEMGQPTESLFSAIPSNLVAG